MWLMAKKEKDLSEVVEVDWKKLLPIIIGLIIGGCIILYLIYFI